jgi:exodeoxyribonuclease VII large subunit
MNARGGVDVIIVGRGGGSPQDLWAFNEEAVVRAIVRSKVPVVSGVGHETDFTLADFAADVRAATPTHAAQLVVKDIEEIRKTLATMSRDARKRIVAELEHARSRLQGYRNHHALREPERRIGDKMQELDRLQERLTRGLRGGVTLRRGAVQLLTTRLRSHSPGRSFARAYDRVESCRRSVLQAVATSLARHREGVASRMRLLDSFGPHRVLERGDLSLEDSIRSFEEGIRLVKQCTSVLGEAEKRIQRLTEEGKAVTGAGEEPEEEEERGADELPF